MIEVLVVDDHAIVREGLKQILSHTSDIVAADDASNGREVLDKISQKDYDVLLLDISMPGKDGLDILKDLKRIKPRLNVLVLTAHPEEQYAVRVLKAGAAGYMTKGCAGEELANAIRKVSTGRKYISPTLAEKLAYDLTGDLEKTPHERLSDREYQVMRLIASGKTVTAVAGELFLSVKTISTYRTRILQKMDMKTNADLTHYAYDNRLFE